MDLISQTPRFSFQFSVLPSVCTGRPFIASTWISASCWLLIPKLIPLLPLCSLPEKGSSEPGVISPPICVARWNHSHTRCLFLVFHSLWNTSCCPNYQQNVELSEPFLHGTDIIIWKLGFCYTPFCSVVSLSYCKTSCMALAEVVP